jgi:DNA-binding transcriptional regulator YdaS (Cro superfamily)
MQLRDYLTQTGITQAAFGRLLNPPVSQGKVNHWLYGARRVSLVEALQIERLTQGQVTLLDLAQLAAPPRPRPRRHAAAVEAGHDSLVTAADQGHAHV